MAITIASAKAKGRRLQQLVANRIGELLGMKVGADEHIASREGCQNGTDVRLIGEAKEKFPYSVECKAQETWSVHSWIEQAKSNKEKDTDWLLVCKRNHGHPVVVMDMDAFFKLYDKLINGVKDEQSSTSDNGKDRQTESHLLLKRKSKTP